MELSDVSAFISLAWLVPVISILKIVVDNWKATDLEKLLMNNFHKFQIAFIKYLSIGIAFGIIFVISDMLYHSKTLKDVIDVAYFAAITVIVIFFLFLVFLLERFFFFVLRKISHKYNYYIENDKEGKQVYRVIKSSGRNHLLVESNGIEEFFDDPKSRRYKKVLQENKKLSDFYRSKTVYLVMSALFIMSILFFVCFIKVNSWFQIVWYLLSLLSILVFIALAINFRLEEKLLKEQEK